MPYTFKRNKPLTKVQKAVMDRIESGDRLVFTENAIYWAREYKDGWSIVDRALYPQVRRLLWYGEIDFNNPNQVLPETALSHNS